MPTEEITIKSDNINGAADEIIGFLEVSGVGRDVTFFNGWYGLGASPVLKAVVNRLKLSSVRGADTRMGVGFEKIIHIDCSMWQSKRALQKAIAEELGLPQQVMAVFDQHDKEDDFDGVNDGARGVIQHVKEAILNVLFNHTFLVVFHNGSGNYIDLWEYGVPVIGLLNKKVLWTFRGRFQLQGSVGTLEGDVKELAGPSNVVIYGNTQMPITKPLTRALGQMLHEEADEVARYTGVLYPNMSKEIIMKCVTYMALITRDDYGTEYCTDSWKDHAPNYWVCDGIMQNGNRSVWDITEALHKNLRMVKYQNWVLTIPFFIETCGESWWRRDRWVSATPHYQQQEEDKNIYFSRGEDIHIDTEEIQVPPNATSFFWIPTGKATAILRASMFTGSDRSGLHVIHLSNCSFSFSSPPFIGCFNLRFLLLDHCKDKDALVVAADHGGEKHSQRNFHNATETCFQKLWVMDLNYTEWYLLLTEEIIGSMAELRELNVKGLKNWKISNLNGGTSSGSINCRLFNLVKLRVTVEPIDVDRPCRETGEPFPDLSSCSNLKTVVLAGCVELEELGPNDLPLSSFESFSFTSNDETNIKSISFRGCNKLKNLFLRGLFRNLVELDMSGTLVKYIDLSSIQALYLKRLFLLGCEKLQAILWPHQKNIKTEMEVLRIDTTQSAAERGGNLDCDYDFYVVLRDARFFRSLLQAGLHQRLHIEVSSAAAADNIVGIRGHRGHSKGILGNVEQLVQPISFLKPAGKLYEDCGTSMDPVSMWPCPQDTEEAHYCYISIQHDTQSVLSQGTTSTKQETTLPNFVHDNSVTLHLHDSSFITCIPGPAPSSVDLTWTGLRWCRIERCPNLKGSIFTAPALVQTDILSPPPPVIFPNLRIFWASHLPKARYIWGWNPALFDHMRSFGNLVFLHISGCPRLVHVLPLCPEKLKQLEIVCCDDLIEVFPYAGTSTFPRLEYILLHHLPKLQRICGDRMSVGQLKTLAITNCWSLRSLPAVTTRTWTFLIAGRCLTPPKVYCNKEWWDGLEWDVNDAEHDPSLYEPIHSKYNKKILLRGSALR